MTKTIFVVGAGKGCGNHVAERFGREGFLVVLMSRSREHLDEYERDLRSKGIETDSAVMDASDLASVTDAFEGMISKHGVPDVLFYNVGITLADADIAGPRDAQVLMDRYRVDVAAAYHAIQTVMGRGFDTKGGAVLVTGGGLALYPSDQYLPLSMDKAALRAMCLALHEAYAPRGVYVGVLTVTGLIAPGERCDPAVLADDFWSMYTERREAEIVR